MLKNVNNTDMGKGVMHVGFQEERLNTILDNTKFAQVNYFTCSGFTI